MALVKPAGVDTNAISIGGTVIPYRSVTVAAQRAGRITALYARTGMMLQFNQPVAALDDDVLRQQIDGIKAELKAAQSDLDYAIFSMPGMDSAGGMMGAMMGAMFGAPGGSGVDAWLARVNRINQARARIDQLKAQERALQAQVGYGAVTAPMDGIVTRRLVEAGEIVQAGQPLIEMAYVSRLRAQFDIPVDLAQGVAPGRPFTLKTSDGRLIPVSVGEVAPGVDPRTHTQQVKVDLPPQSGLRLGDYVELLLARAGAASTGSVVIPAAALLRGSALPMVQVVTGDGTFKIMIVRVAERLPDGQLLISAGLSAGDVVKVQP
ncbi:efflux RND transporter periplasmic adaptor subunit [Halothiobacillus sp. 15-55-196]|uniref:efflux RND transporter periplasmic adaptor subunit n=1 Tax=Halothiobacillus sp. 15-55-196 TaxID=1970382 RepID=UPI0025B8116C|nr:efflux RND transporter periplasmic adaptor subunit [Halothiobacillus sp. 15-55-196]